MRKLMSNDDYELFEMIVKSTQTKLHKMLYKILKRHYKNIINTQDYLMAQGDIPVALVAHMDTVFKLPPEKIYFDRKKNVLWSPDGLGADDRAGVFLILKIIQKVRWNKKPTIIFTTDEEQGCIGASNLALDFSEAPWDLKYLIQLDRRGQNDCVFYDDTNKNFLNYVEKFGFKDAWGTFSDISIICPSWGISGVNLSVGYEDEHREIETLHIRYTYRTLDRVLAMLEDIDNVKKFKYVEDKTSFKWWNYNTSRWTDEEDDYEYDYPYSFYGGSREDFKVYCHGCGQLIDKATNIKAKDKYGQWHYYCSNCVAEKIKWCVDCGEPYEFSTPSENKCCDCICKDWENGKV